MTTPSPRRGLLRRLLSNTYDPVTVLGLALAFQLVVFVLVLAGEPYDAGAFAFVGGTAGLLIRAIYETRRDRPSEG